MAGRCLGCMNPIQDGLDVCPVCGYVQTTQPKEAYQLVPGTILKGRYQIGKAIGYGGFGVTYIGYDTVLDSKVAIKEYFPAEFATRMPGVQTLSIYSGEAAMQFESGLISFIAESKAYTELADCPSIVKIYDVFIQNNTGYRIGEFLEVEILTHYLQDNGGKISYEDAFFVFLPVMDALEALHKKHRVHGEITPYNIAITKDKKIKLMGIDAATYKSGQCLYPFGDYSPPEQFLNKSILGPRTDIYELGATIYRSLTGVVPQDSIERSIKDELEWPSKLGVQLPPSIEKTIMKALALKPRSRFRTIPEMRKAFTEGESIKQRR